MKNKKVIISVICVCLLILIGRFLFGSNLNTQMALSSKIEDSSVHKAIIIRNEKIVIDTDGNTPKETNGIIQTHVFDGEYVKKAKNVATFYKNDESEATKDIQQKLAKVTDRINQIKESASVNDMFESDVSRLEDDTKQYIRKFALASYKNDARSISKIKAEIEYAAGKRSDANGEKIKDELASLEADKARYEKNLENLKKELYSPSSGIFMASVDGFEEILTKNIINSITVDDFKQIYAQKEKENLISCKIIDNYIWYAAIDVDSERAKSFKVGEQVFLRFSNINKDFNANIESISETKNGKNVICVSSSDYDVDISTLRKTDITLIKNIYSGLLVPSKAIKKVDGKTGVYAIKGKTVTFVETDIIYDDGENVIVKEYNPFVDANIPLVKLNLYDEVVVSGRGVYDGKLVK